MKPPGPSVTVLLGQLADRWDAHGPAEWSPALVSTMIAIMDLHFAERGTNKAAVLQLVKR